MTQLFLFPQCPPTTAEPAPLESEDRDAVLDRLLKGLSPQMACQKLGLDVRAFWRTVEENAEFRRRLRQVRSMMSENVAAIVYRAAVEGTPAAQAQWLRTFSPPTYADPDSPQPAQDTLDELAEHPFDELRLIRQAFDSAFPFEPEPRR